MDRWKGESLDRPADHASHLLEPPAAAKFKGEPAESFSGNNDDTFKFDNKRWSSQLRQLDEVMTEWENAVPASDEEKLKSWYSIIAHIGTHNAYHIGQILFVRKEQGSWNPEKGVK